MDIFKVNKMKKVSLISALLLVGSFNVSAMELVVDNFDSAFGGVISDNGNAGGLDTASFGPAGAGVIVGGWRDIGVDRVSGALASKIDVYDSGIPAHNGVSTFSNDGFNQGIGIYQYDGANDGSTATNAHALGLDVSMYDSIEADFLSADFGFDFAVRLYSDVGNYSEISSVLASVVFVPGSVDNKSIALSDFLDCAGEATCVGTGVDFMNISAIEIGFQSTRNDLDLTFDNIGFTVPEPSSLALLGLGMLSFGFASRRKSKATLQA